MKHIIFLTTEEVLKIYENQMKLFGGKHLILNLDLLESAVHEPQATYAGEFLYPDVYSMGAAYAYCIIKNHAFFDGNKRTGMIAALMFLQANGIDVKFKDDEFYSVGYKIANSKMDIDDIVKIFRKRSK